MKLKNFLIFAVILFLFISGTISKFSELIFIAHSYIFALGIIVVFIIFTLWLLFSEGQINRATFNPFMIIFLLVSILLTFFSIAKYDSIVETYRIVAPVLLFLIIINTIQEDRRGPEMPWTLDCNVPVQACFRAGLKIYSYALVGFGLFVGILSYIKFYSDSFGTSALSSIWGYTNTFAAFLVLMILASVGIYLNTQNKNIKRLNSLVPMFFIFLLFLTVSRGGYLALIVAFVTFCLLGRHNLKVVSKEILPIIIGSVILIIVGTPREIILANFGKTAILAKFVAGVSQNASLWDRVHMFSLAIKIFLKKPLTGFGFGSFRYTFTVEEWVSEPFRIDPHSLFFKFLAETGVIGTLSFFSMIGYFLLKAFRKIRFENENFLYKGVFAGTIGMFFHMCIDVDIYPIMFVVLFYAIALLVPQEYIPLKASHKKIFAIVSIILVLVVSFDLLPKSIASTYAIRGENPNSLKAVDTSIKLLRKASEIDPKSSQYYFYLGEFISKSIKSYDEGGRIDEMIEAYKNAYNLNKYDYRAPFRLGMAYLFNKDKNAVDYLEEAEKLYPTNPNILVWLSVAYNYILKDRDTAGIYLKKAEEYSWGGLDLNFAKGVYELIKGNKSEADKYFSNLAFYDEIYQKFGAPRNYLKGTYNLQLKIIKDIEQEMNE